MSRRVCVQCEVRNMLIMKDTLKQMGYQFNVESENVIQVSFPWMEINAQEGSIHCDSMHRSTVDLVKKTYMANFYRDKAIREGNQVEEETTSKGEVILHIRRA